MNTFSKINFIFRESIRIEYFPSNQGISLKHFPYQGKPYHQPLVSIKVSIKKGLTINNRH